MYVTPGAGAACSLRRPRLREKFLLSFLLLIFFNVDTRVRMRCTRFVAKEMHCREVSIEPDYDTVFYGLFVMRVFVLCCFVDLLRRRPDGEVRI